MKYPYAEMKSFKQNDVILHKGQLIEFVYFIRTGEVAASADLPDSFLLSAGEVFGELSFIYEVPAKYDYVAHTDCLIEVFNPRSFSELFDVELGSYLRPIFQNIAEHLRETEIKLADLSRRETKLRGGKKNPQLSIEPLTAAAKNLLQNRDFLHITQFPFRVGRFSRRRSDELFHKNNFYLYDEQPYTVSRSHFAVVATKNILSYIDRGSFSGAWINGIKIGGEDGESKKINLNLGNNSVVIGNRESGLLFNFKVEY